MIKKHISIRGLCVSIEIPRENGRSQLIKRKLVSPEFIQLWFKVHDNQWDQDLWERLNQRDKDYLGICIRNAHIFNREYEKAVGRDFSKYLERLRLLEESIKAGNISPVIQDEFNDIIDRLVSSGQFTSIHGTKLKKRLARSMAEAR